MSLFSRISNGRSNAISGGSNPGNRPVCKFYLEGRCRYGDSCHNYHPPKDQNQSQSQNRGGLPFHLNQDAIKSDLTTGDEKPTWPLSAYGPGKDAPRQLLEGPVEQSPEEIRVQYYLAKASGGTQGYESEEANALQGAEQQVQRILGDLQGAVKYVLDGKDAHPNREDKVQKGSGNFQWKEKPSLGQQAGGSTSTPFGDGQSSSAFGGGQSSSAFGGGSSGAFGQPSALGSQQQTTSAFGQPSSFGSSSAFGSKPATSTPFGQQSQPSSQGSAFGQASAPGSQGSAFGAPSALGSSSSAFGKPSALGGGGSSAFGQLSAMGGSSSAFGQGGGSTGGSAFGQPSQPGGGSAFGKPTAFGASASSGSAFGQSSAFGGGTSQQSSGTSAFGQPSAPGGQQSAFGQPSAAGGQQSAFGQQSTPSGGSAFGQASAPSQQQSAFGHSSAPSSGSAFGKPSPFGAAASGGSAFGQPSQSGQQSAFGSSPTPFGASSTNGSAFGRPSSSGQQSNPFGSGGSTGAAQSSAPFGSTASSGFGTQASQNGPSFGGAQTIANRTPGQPLTSWKGQAVIYDNKVPYWNNPQTGKKERIWHPDGPPPANPDVEAAPSTYNSEALTSKLKQVYDFVCQHGTFKDGIIPEIPPKREWVSWDL